MKRMKLIVVLLIFMWSTVAFSQVFLKRDNKRIVNGSGEVVILRAIGLGGWMLQEGYMLQTESFANTQHEIRAKIESVVGRENTDAFYDAWLASHCRKRDVDSLAAWGFNSIRLPMHYNLFTLPIEEEPVKGQNTWREKGFEMIDSLLAWCEDNEMYLILDLHAAPGGQGSDAPISDYDPAKPSLWESAENRAKTAALWRRLAERYADEPWIGGYDLINEPNWDLPGNAALKQLYLDITAAIRQVDENHILFIEGNWFANDFTGLTPPWDDNMVYSFHKYHTYNDQNAIQWMLSIRDAHNIPIWCGEAGENSNAWYRDAIRLFENNSIGWAWWPLKKVESISGPLSVKKPAGYQTLLNYWSGSGGKPSTEFALNVLMDLAENLKVENCEFHPDVIDAMFRQVQSNAIRPYKSHHIPGLIFATDYDMGAYRYAYSDKQVANYQYSAGSFTSWNDGWSYRNDGVDIEPCQDAAGTNGYNVGWIESGEWLKYTIWIDSAAIYQAKLRVASQSQGGKFHIELDGKALLNEVIQVPVTGGWQSWRDVTVNDIILDKGEHVLTLFFDEGGFNVNWFSLSAVARVENQGSSPVKYALSQNYPNPFNFSTTIDFSLEKPGVVTLKMYNLLGEEIETLIDERRPAGAHKITWTAKNVSSGIFVYRLQVGVFVDSKKLVLLR
jgi:endoglucanase